MTKTEIIEPPAFSKPFASLAIGTLSIFAAILIFVIFSFRNQVRQQINNRDAILLESVSQNAFDDIVEPDLIPISIITVAIDASELRGVIGIRAFYPVDTLIQTVPTLLYSTTLSESDAKLIAQGERIVRYHPAYPVNSLFADDALLLSNDLAPVTELIIPIRDSSNKSIGAIQFWVDAELVQREFAQLDHYLFALTSLAILGGSLVLLLLFFFARGRILFLANAINRQNKRLLDSQTALTAAAKASALGAVTGHLIHGLKNPLSSLSQRLKNDEFPDPETMEMADRMQAIISESIAFIQQNEGLQAIEFTTAELANTAESRFAPVITKMGCRFEIFTKGEATLDGKTTSIILLILRNLIDNALQASPPNGRIALSFEVIGTDLYCRISDEGLGIPEDLQANLFKPGISTKTNGTGIGLSLSSSLADSINGELSFENQIPKSGSTFLLRIMLS